MHAINNILYYIIINTFDKYNPYINDNGFLLIEDIMETKGPAIEFDVLVLVKYFQDMKFIQCYLKESVDKYLNDVEKKF